MRKKKDFIWHDIKRTVLAFMLLIIISTGFNAFLNTLAFKTIYVNALISHYHAVGSVLRKKVELSLSFGKKIDNFFGMDSLLANNLKYLAHINSNPSAQSDVHLFIADIQGKILYTTKKDTPRFSLETIKSLGAVSPPAVDSKKYLIQENHYFIVFPIKNWDSSPAAVQVIFFPEDLITEYLDTLIKKSMIIWCAVLIASFTMLLLIFYLCLGRTHDLSKPLVSILKTKKFSYGLFGTIVLCQMLFSASQIHGFAKHYLTINQNKAVTISIFINDQLENLVKKGVDLKNLNRAEQFIHSMIADIPEFDYIMISDPQGRRLYYSDQNAYMNHHSDTIQAIDLNPCPKYLRTKTIMDGDRKTGTISVSISEKGFNTFFWKIFLDTGTIIVISIFFCVEIMILLFIGIGKKRVPAQKELFPTRIIRPIAFVYFFAIDIVVSFVPLYMKDLYCHSPGFSISRDMAMGLPITVQMIFSAISILLVGGWCDKKGWLQPFLSGVIFSALGFLAAAIINSPILFIAALAMAGFGYGLSYIAAQNFVTTNCPPEKKAQGLSEYYAGCIAGSLCGVVTGSMLAEQIGFANVFLIGFGILICLFVWIFFFMRRNLSPAKKGCLDKVSDTPISVMKFLSDKQIFYLIFLNIVPAAILLVGFLNYFVPVYLQENNIPQSDIGRAFMLYGICMIYVAPVIIQRINTLEKSIIYITMGGIFGSMTLLTFFFTSGYTAVVASILFLGLGASFNALRNAYALNLNICKKFGEGRATSLIFFLARLGQALGPIIFAWLAISGDNTTKITTAGLFFLSLSIMFFLLSHFSAKKAILK